ncbi:4a-hydroxytetrahydrobiopterin dehydratase [Limnobacter sp.]|uniref:4a-hydroxytetrahydrobiopterin dehydratase n=1 Tax=Limnobacter sp. TaxID=2003368 RepID=UPI0025DE63D1|nr:4a-hydroxytetrahydrobiopterin dehydratase [uncultured Limnobacter sp.]
MSTVNTPHPARPQEDWLHVHCQHLGEGHAWSADEIEAQLDEFEYWSVEFDAKGEHALNLWRQYAFANFEGVKLAVHAITHLADDEDHHPEVTFGYNRVKVRWNTHSANGITNNDWACAAKLDDALKHIG